MGMFTIWKFPLPVDTDDFTVDMPASIDLSLQVQGRVPCLWAAVMSHPEGRKPSPVRFVWVATGHPIPDAVKNIPQSFVGTVQLPNGLVLHLFRVWP
jgi:hypothetical protein